MDSLDMNTLTEENVRLRQERLCLYNMISVANDEIRVFSAQIKGRRKKIGKLSEEAREFFDIMVSNHTENIDFYLECLRRETDLLEKSGNEDISMYILELEQIYKQKISSCEYFLNIIRALRLSNQPNNL